MGRVLRQARVYDDAGSKARRPLGKRLPARLRRAPARRAGLCAARPAAAGSRARRERHAAHEPRAGSADPRMPGPVPVGLQPLQAAKRRSGSGVSKIIFALLWMAHFLPYRVLALIGNVVGVLAFWLIPERRHVTRVHLEECFPGIDGDGSAAL